MERVIINQQFPFSIKAQFGFPLTVAAIVLTYSNIYFLLLLILTLLFMFTSYAYEFNKNLMHRLNIKVFGMKIFSLDKTFIEPDYISLFNQPLKYSKSLGFMEMGKLNYKEFTIKFFKDNYNETIFRSSDKSKVLRIGKELSVLLEVELYNTLE